MTYEQFDLFDKKSNQPVENQAAQSSVQTENASSPEVEAVPEFDPGEVAAFKYIREQVEKHRNPLTRKRALQRELEKSTRGEHIDFVGFAQRFHEWNKTQN